MKTNETLQINIKKKSINELNSGPNCHCDTVIEPLISYDKFLDDLVLFTNISFAYS